MKKIALLAQPSQSITLESYEHLLTQIQNLKEKIKTRSEINDLKWFESQDQNQPQYFASQYCEEFPTVENHRVRFQQTSNYMQRRHNIRVKCQEWLGTNCPMSM